MRKLSVAIFFTMLLLGAVMSSAAISTHDDNEITAPADSTVEVIGWFCKNDTLVYWIHESEWKISPEDSVMTLGISTKVMVNVTDSTASGYKMNYTFLEFQSDSTATSTLGNFQNQLVGRLSSKITGTTVRFETDDCGRITKFNNLGEIKKQAKTLFKDAMNELMDLPEMQPLKTSGVNLKDITKMADTDNLVDGYLEELKLLFICHGSAYELGEKSTHEDATDNQYENETYLSASTDTEDGTYQIVYDVINIIPQSDLTDLTAGRLSELLPDISTSEAKKNLNESFKSIGYQDCINESYLRLDYLPGGWPYSVVKQTSTTINDTGKIKQTTIQLDSYSLYNY